MGIGAPRREGDADGLEEAQFVRPGDCLGAMADAQLSVPVRDVALHGGQADHQVVGDLLVPHACRNQTQDLDFPRRERFGETSDDDPRRGGREVSLLLEGR